MKRSVKPLLAQMNLAFGNLLTTANLDDQQKDLIVALMELLVSAAEAEERNEQPRNGGENESEAHA